MRSAKVSALALLCLCACNRGSYYPLDERLTWDYVVTMQRDTGDQEEKPKPRRGQASVTNLPRRTLNGVEVTPRMFAAGSQFSFVFTAEDESGVHVVATQPPGVDEPVPVEERSDALRYPAVAGTEWDDTGETHFLDEPVTVKGRTKIAADGETVTVPAGRFTHCKRLVFTGSAKSRIPHQFGSVTVEIESEYWLAPGVGMVKLIHKERIDRPSGKGGDLTFELKTFKKV